MKNVLQYKQFLRGSVATTMAVLSFMAAFFLSSCSKDLDSPVLPANTNVVFADGVSLDSDTLFGIWKGEEATGNPNTSHFTETYKVEFSDVADSEAVLSHCYSDGSSEIADSTVNLKYTYSYDGTGVELVPTTAARTARATTIKGVYLGNKKMNLYTEDNGFRSSICTLTRTGGPKPSITSVDRTLPEPGEQIIINGRNLQFVDHVYLPGKDGEIEATDITKGSKQLLVTVPYDNFTPGCLRITSDDGATSISSPSYMFCRNCVFFKSFSTEGTKSPFTGTELENTVNMSSTVYSSSSAVDDILTFYKVGSWPVTDANGDGYYFRFSSGDRFQYVLNSCDGYITSNTPCSKLAIQMDIYVESNGEPVWNTGFLAYRMNKDAGKTTTDLVHYTALWNRDVPMSFADGWHTITIPLSAFTATAMNFTSIGALKDNLLSKKLTSMLMVVNCNYDGNHPATVLNSFCFHVKNMRLVPYK